MLIYPKYHAGSQNTAYKFSSFWRSIEAPVGLIWIRNRIRNSVGKLRILHDSPLALALQSNLYKIILPFLNNFVWKPYMSDLNIKIFMSDMNLFWWLYINLCEYYAVKLRKYKQFSIFKWSNSPRLLNSPVIKTLLNHH